MVTEKVIDDPQVDPVVKKLLGDDISILFCGDSHGHVDDFYHAVDRFAPRYAFHAGDFSNQERDYEEFYHQRLSFLERGTRIDICCGNHENYPYIKRMEGWGKANGIHTKPQILNLPELSILIVPGAFSTDAMNRVDWYPEEQSDQEELDQIVREYEAFGGTDIILSHCAPTSEVMMFPEIWMEGGLAVSRTMECLEQIKKVNVLRNPDLWICGHYHKSNSVLINRASPLGVTHFRMLDQNEIYEYRRERENE